LLWLRSRPLPASAEGTTLVVAPHPDDDALGCAGLMMQRHQAGARLHVVYLTDGAGSHPAHPTLTPETLAAQRQHEARAALAALGLAEAAGTFLGLRDGSLHRLAAAERARLVAGLRGVLARERPAEIVLPCRGDGSSEHEAAFQHLQAALAGSDATWPAPRLLEFPVWAWRDPRRLWRPAWRSRQVWRCEFPARLEAKLRAIRAHRSQVAAVPPWTEPVLGADFVSCFSRPVEFFFAA
jgi:LmbE family N-acetylglucosaminyl deacetylase